MTSGGTIFGRLPLLLASGAIALAGVFPVGQLLAEVQDTGVAPADVVSVDAAASDAAASLAPADEQTVAVGVDASPLVPLVSSGGSAAAEVSEDVDEPDFVQEPNLVEVEGGSEVAMALSDATPWRSPDDADERGGIGSEHWSHEDYARASGNLYAYVELNDNQVSRYLDVHDFDFNIPDAATVTGIEVDVERKVNDTTGMSPVRDYSVRLLKDGDVVGENRATETNYPGVDTYETHGTPTDLWGESWTPAEINAHGFGVVLAVKKFGHVGGDVYALVDHVRVRVTFTMDVQQPVATPPAGTYVGTQLVTLSVPTSTSDWAPASVWYTTDGSDPACGTGIEYADPIEVAGDLSIRALSCYPLDYSSDVAVFEYVIDEPPAVVPPTEPASGGGGAPLPGGPSMVPQVYEPTPQVLGASTVNPVVPRVLGAATCLSKLDDPMGVVRPDAGLAKRLAGRILLKVQACGEAWYVNPATFKRHKLGVVEATDVARSLALKVTDEQLKTVTVGSIDSRKGKAKVPAAYSGRMLQSPSGSLWYVNPADGKRYEVTTADQMLKVMRLLGVGISSANIAKIQVADLN